MRSNKFIILSLLFAVTVVFFGCGQIAPNKNLNENGNLNFNQNTNLNNNTNTNTNSTQIDTSNWQTYRNEEYGFSVKYPEGWEVEAGNKKINAVFTLTSPVTKKKIEAALSRNRATEIPTGDIIVSIYAIDKEKSLRSYLEENKQSLEIVSYNNIKKVGNIEAYEAQIGGFSLNYAVFYKKGEYLLRFFFELREDQIYLSEAERVILNSFKFAG